MSSTTPYEPAGVLLRGLQPRFARHRLLQPQADPRDRGLMQQDLLHVPRLHARVVTHLDVGPRSRSLSRPSRGQPRTASGSRSAIARVVFFDTEWASRPAIVRLGHMQEVFLRETAVSWIRLRPASTVPSKAWLETKEQYVCQQAQRGRGRHQCRFGCRGSVQKPPKAARSCDRSQGRSNTQMSG